MAQDFQAIYEHGVLRPTTPLSLPELAEVTGTLQQITDIESLPKAANSDELRHQQKALDAMFAEVDGLPQFPRHDGLSGRDHDQILYGNRS